VLDQPPPIICSIVQEEISNRLQLRGRVISRQETQGNFSLRVIKNGPSGSSTIAQSGNFSTSANAETIRASPLTAPGWSPAVQLQ